MLFCLSALPLGVALAQEVPRAAVQEAIPAFPREEMRQVFAAGFAAILDRHTERALPSDLATWALAGFASADTSLRVERLGRELRLMRGRRALLSRILPSDSLRGGADANGLSAAEALAQFQEAAWLASPPVRDAGRDTLLRASFAAVFGHLDPFSRYVTPEEAQLARDRRLGQGGVGLRRSLHPGLGDQEHHQHDVKLVCQLGKDLAKPEPAEIGQRQNALQSGGVGTAAQAGSYCCWLVMMAQSRLLSRCAAAERPGVCG